MPIEISVYLSISRYPTNNNMPDTVMNYAAQLTGAASPGTTMAAAAHFYQQQVSTCIYSWLVQLAREPQWQLLPTSTNNRLVPVHKADWWS